MKTSHPPFSSLPQPWDRIVPHIAIVIVWGYCGWLLRALARSIVLFISFDLLFAVALTLVRLDASEGCPGATPGCQYNCA